jgi:hypothetical protein
MVVTMLTTLRPAGKKMSVFFNIAEDFIIAFKSDSAGFIFFDLYICLAIKPTTPFFLLFGSGYRVYYLENLSGFYPK